MECRRAPGGTPGALHQFAFFSTTTQRISKISVSMKSSVHVLSKYEGITMFEFLKFDTWANNRHIGCTSVVQRWVHRDPWVADLDSWKWTILACQRSWKYENMKKMKTYEKNKKFITGFVNKISEPYNLARQMLPKLFFQIQITKLHWYFTYNK